MTPALLVASCAAALVPALLRADLPPGATPITVLFDVSTRVFTGLIGAGLIAVVVATEVSKDGWSTTDVTFVGSLAATLIGLQGVQFVAVGWARFSTAHPGQPTAQQTAHPRKPAPATSFIVGVLGATMLAPLTVSALYAAASTSPDVAIGTVMTATVILGLALMTLAWAALALERRIEPALPTRRTLARALASLPGAWTDFAFLPVNVGSPTTLIKPVYVHEGRHYLQIGDAHALVRFRRECAVAATHPTAGLHTREMTICPASPGYPLGRTFGFRTWEPSPRRPFARVKAHWKGEIDSDDFLGLPPDTNGLLVPFHPELLSEAGLEAYPANKANRSRMSLPG